MKVPRNENRPRRSRINARTTVNTEGCVKEGEL